MFGKPKVYMEIQHSDALQSGFVNLISTTPREYGTDPREYHSPQGDHPLPHRPFYLEKGVLGNFRNAYIRIALTTNPHPLYKKCIYQIPTHPSMRTNFMDIFLNIGRKLGKLSKTSEKL